MRTDIHSPKNIDPRDYKLVTFRYFGPSAISEELYARGRLILDKHMRTTGGKMSDHNHGGSCHVCGAHAHYLAVYYHEKTNTYIETGFDCADKMNIGDSVAFKKFTKEIKKSKEFIAGKTKAQATLQKEGLEQCWTIYEEPTPAEFEERTITDIVGKLVRYGSISQKQTDFLRNLVSQIPQRVEKRKALEEKIKTEKENAAPCPEGRVTVVGEVVSVKWQDTIYGSTRKMLVKSEEGFTIWGTVPSNVKVPMVLGEDGPSGIEKGDKIQFSAKLSPSEDDNKFGFFSRPTKAEILKVGEENVHQK